MIISVNFGIGNYKSNVNALIAFLEYLDLNNYEQCCNAYGRYTQILLIKKAELMASEKEKGFIISCH